MASVIVEIIFEDGKCMDRIYKSDANNPEEDALMRAQEEWGKNASAIRVISTDKD